MRRRSLQHIQSQRAQKTHREPSNLAGFAEDFRYLSKRMPVHLPVQLAARCHDPPTHGPDADLQPYEASFVSREGLQFGAVGQQRQGGWLMRRSRGVLGFWRSAVCVGLLVLLGRPVLAQLSSASLN